MRRHQLRVGKGGCVGALLGPIVAVTLMSMYRASLSPDLEPFPPVTVLPEVAKPATPGVRVLTLNVAHGRELAFHQSLLSRKRVARGITRVGDVIRAESPDVLLLQEADGPSVWSGYFDHVDTLSRYTGLDFAVRGQHTQLSWPWVLDYGTAVVSRYPVTFHRSRAFKQSSYDTKGYVRATVRVPSLGGAIDLVSVHLDFLRKRTRARQTAMLIEDLLPRERPLILAGDFNCEWGEDSSVATLTQALGLAAWQPQAGEPTFPNQRPRTRIDWILVSPELAFSRYATLTAPVSDHRGVVADITLATPADSRR